MAIAEGDRPVVLIVCPHGDDSCPCPDGDPCHYEPWGDSALRCPNRPDTWNTGTAPSGYGNHCHQEGCRWPVTRCGLEKIGVELPEVPFPGVKIGTPEWVCGVMRQRVYGWPSSYTISPTKEG